MAFTAPSAIAGLTTATLTFEYETIEETSTDRIYKIGTDWVLVAPKSILPTKPPRLIARDVDGNIINRHPIISQDVVLRERDTQPLTETVEIGFYEEDADVPYSTMPLRGNFDLKFRDLPSLVEAPPEPEPEPDPSPDPDDVIEYRVIWDKGNPPGMNVRADHDVNAAKVGDLPTGAIVECDESRFWLGDSLGWLPIVSGQFAGHWVAFYSFVPGDPFNIVDEYLIPAEDYVEPEPTGTVQTTGALQLATSADGWTHVKGGDGNGFNMRYMATGRYNPDEYLDFIAGHGLKWVRVYFSQEKHTLQQCIDKFRPVLDKAAARGLLICGVITDSLGHSGMIIEEDRPWHTGGGIGHLNIDWIMSKQYEKDYFRFVEGFAAAFKEHPGLGMIELVNEAGIYGVSPIELHHADAYTEWMAESARLAYTASDGKQLIAFGGINTLHSRPPMKPLADHARDLIKACKYIQVWGDHFYSEKDYHPEALYRFEEDCHTYDYRFAKEYGKAIFGTEIGSWFTNQNRPLSTEEVMKRNRGKWCGAFYWGLALDEDNGEADAHSMALFRDGQSEFDGMLAALKA